MKKVEELKPNYSPVYAALYPAFAKIFQNHGYALAIHGSMARDFDVIAVPWGENLSHPDKVLEEITKEFVVSIVGEPTKRSYGRLVYTISIGHGECAVDLSFFPNFYREEDYPQNGSTQEEACKVCDHIHVEVCQCDCPAVRIPEAQEREGEKELESELLLLVDKYHSLHPSVLKSEIVKLLEKK